MKKIVCAALMIALLVTQAVGAFAAVTVSTTTSWNAETTDDVNDITVTSIVGGLTSGEQVTYLAYTGSEPTDTSIVYIDQIEADDSSETFTYTTTNPASKVTVYAASKVDTEWEKVGGTGADYVPLVSTITLAGDLANVTITEPTDNTKFSAMTGYTVDTTKAITGITKNGTAVTWYVQSGVLYILNADLANGAEYTVSTTSIDSEAAAIALDKAGYYNGNLYMFATVKPGASAFGMKVTPEVGTATDYEALAYGTNGDFVVELTEVTDGKYDIAAYADGTVTDATTVVVEANN